jgi:hypothetical protein
LIYDLADLYRQKREDESFGLFCDHQQCFPTLFKIMQREASRRAVEVGCERFFGLSGYMCHNPVDLHSVFGIMSPLLCWQLFCRVCLLIQVGWQQGSGKENTIESFKCFNLERILDSKMYGKDEPDHMTKEDYMKFGEKKDNSTTDN